MEVTTIRRSQPVTGPARQAILARAYELVFSPGDDPDPGPLVRLFQCVCLNVLREADGRPLSQSAVRDKLASLTAGAADPPNNVELNWAGINANDQLLFSKTCLAGSVIETLDERVGGSESSSFQSEWISRALNPLLERACLDLQLDWIACAGKLVSPKWVDPAPAATGTGWQLIWYRKNRHDRPAKPRRAVPAGRMPAAGANVVPAEVATDPSPAVAGDEPVASDDRVAAVNKVAQPSAGRSATATGAGAADSSTLADEPKPLADPTTPDVRPADQPSMAPYALRPEPSPPTQATLPPLEVLPPPATNPDPERVEDAFREIALPPRRRRRADVRRWAVPVLVTVIVAALAVLIAWPPGGGGRGTDRGAGERGSAGGDAGSTNPTATRPATAPAPPATAPTPPPPTRPATLPSAPDGKRLLDDADRALAANQFRQAEAKFTEAIRGNRGERLAMSHLGRGQARCLLGDFGGAIDDLNRAVAGLSSPSPSDSAKRIVAVCYQRRAEAFRGGVRDPALRASLFTALDKGLGQIPSHPKLNCLEAEYWVYDRSNPDRKSKAAANLALALGKENYAHASFLQAVWQFKAGQYEDAVKWCDTAAAEDGQFAATRQLRADALDRLGRGPEAAADRARAEELDRANPGRALAGTAIPWLDPWP